VWALAKNNGAISGVGGGVGQERGEGKAGLFADWILSTRLMRCESSANFFTSIAAGAQSAHV